MPLFDELAGKRWVLWTCEPHRNMTWFDTEQVYETPYVCIS